MSTYYKIVCDDHMERTDAASRTAGGHCFLSDGKRTLLPFIIAHCGCRIRIVSEHDDDYHDEDFQEWKEEGVAREIQDARQDNRWR